MMSDTLPGFPTPPGAAAPAAVVVKPTTERDMLDALHRRYAVASQGDSIRYAVAEHVRSSASSDARRVCDFMAQDLWHSGGLALHGHEVKLSRSDWLRELADPDKAETFMRYCDRWWLVVPDAQIVRPGELPERWGMIVVTNGVGHVKRSAPKLAPVPHPVSFRAALLRATAKTSARRGLIVQNALADAQNAQAAVASALASAEQARLELRALREATA